MRRVDGAPTGGMSGRTVLVTGATRGIGLETARQLAAMGARVVLGVRDPARGAAVAMAIESRAGAAELLQLDLASFASVRAAADRFGVTHGRLDVLVNNAGIAVKTRARTADRHERTWQTNFLSHVLLTRLLLPALRRGARPRIVNVSSEGHRSGRIRWDDLELERPGAYGRFRAYANTKLAQVLFTRELARREPGIAVNALHPGAIATDIWGELSPFMRAIAGWIVKSPEQGAAPVTRLASDPALDGGGGDAVTGRYFRRFRETAPSAAGSDDDAAARLWAYAAKEIGLSA